MNVQIFPSSTWDIGRLMTEKSNHRVQIKHWAIGLSRVCNVKHVCPLMAYWPRPVQHTHTHTTTNQNHMLTLDSLHSIRCETDRQQHIDNLTIARYLGPDWRKIH